MKPEDISRKAERERQKLLQEKDNVAPEQKIYKTYNAFSFYTYSKIFPRNFNFALWMFAAIAGIAMIVVYFFDGEIGSWLLCSGITCIGIFFLRWMIEFAQKILTYKSYKNFPASLGFQLKGWETLGSYPKQLGNRMWSKNTTIEVVVKDRIHESQMKFVKDALYLFITKANKHFYEAEIGGDGRTTWDFERTLKIKGSSNPAVIGEMYTLINIYLQSIQEKHPVISAVNVKFDSNIFAVNPPPNND